MRERERVDGLEINPRRAWRFQRAGWGMMALALGIALAGLLGPGPLSYAIAEDPDGKVRVEYNRLDHYGSQSRLRVWVAPGSAANGRLRLRLNEAYLRSVRIEQIMPEPERVEAVGEGVFFVFAISDETLATKIDFDLQPSRFGRVEGRMAVAEGRPASFTQFLFP